MTLREAIESAEEAIARGWSNAPARWRRAALKAIHHVARTQRTLISDDVWDTGLPPAPTDSRALGAAMREAARRGWIKATDRTVKGRGLNRNATDIRVWRSLIGWDE